MPRYTSFRLISRLWPIHWSLSWIRRTSSIARKAIDRHRKDLYYENWDFVIQQQLPGDWLFQVGYTGGEGHHLFDRATINRINPATGKRPLAGFGSFGLKENNANNNFNAFEVSLHRRFTRGLLFQANLHVVARPHRRLDRVG